MTSVQRLENTLGVPALARQRLSQRPQEAHQVLLLLFIELHTQDEVEELDGVFERQQAIVVEIRR